VPAYKQAFTQLDASLMKPWEVGDMWTMVLFLCCERSSLRVLSCLTAPLPTNPRLSIPFFDQYVVTSVAATSVAVTVFDLQAPANNRVPRVVDSYVDEVGLIPGCL
jgi:hypothetical protein